VAIGASSKVHDALLQHILFFAPWDIFLQVTPQALGGLKFHRVRLIYLFMASTAYGDLLISPAILWAIHAPRRVSMFLKEPSRNLRLSLTTKSAWILVNTGGVFLVRTHLIPGKETFLGDEST
jgi:hypothetical protein